jgi:hypothetical protein
VVVAEVVFWGFLEVVYVVSCMLNRVIVIEDFFGVFRRQHVDRV